MSNDIDKSDQPCPSCNGTGSTDIVEPSKKEINAAALALIDCVRSDQPAAYALAKALIRQGWQSP